MKRLFSVSLLLLLLIPAVHVNQFGATVRAQRLIDRPCKRVPNTNCAPHGWYLVGPGTPGVVAPIAVDPAGSGIVYSGSIGSGGLRKSTNGGATWSNVSVGITSLTSSGIGAYSVALDASGPNTVYVGVFAPNRPGPAPASFGVYKTIDGGATWELLPNNVGLFASLATDPSTPGVIYEGALDGFIDKSTNGGATWVRSRNGTAPIMSIVIDPVNTNIVYAATLGGGLVKTTNAGLTWTVLPELPTTAIWGVGIDPANDDVVYAATHDSGVWRSADGGATWQRTGAIGGTPYSFAVDASSHIVFAATTAGVWESANDGASWTQTTLANRMTFSLVLGPGGVLYAGTALGPEISTDHGTTWTDPDSSEGGGAAFGYAVTVDPNTHRVIASTLGATAMISDNKGLDWHPVGIDYAARESRAIRVDVTDPNRVYSGSFYSGVFKSEDGGATWSPRRFGSGFPYVWVVVPDPVSNNIVYAGTQGEGVWKSYDYGDSWTRLFGTMPRVVQGLTVNPTNDNEVFFATPSGVLRSRDGGQTFTNVLPLAAWTITVIGGDSQVVYATTKTSGVYRSYDGGSSFSPINDGLTSLVMGRAAPVLVDPKHPNVLYVGSETAGAGGAFKSFNGGDSWTAINDGLDDRAVFGMALDTDRPGLLYIAGPSGIYRTTTGGE